MNLTAIIIDDEAHAVRTLTAQLGWTKLPIEVIGTANTIEKAEELLMLFKPDFLFLDIKMPKSNGFDLFPIIDTNVTEVIITTAHDQYALKAFKYQASGYLMKPVSTLELKSILEKLIPRHSIIVESHQDLIIEEKSGVQRFSIQSILYVSAESGYTVINFENGIKKTTSKLLKELEVDLTNKNFIRCHHKYLVNTAHINEIKKARNSSIVISNGLTLPVSRSKKYMVYSLFDLLH